MLLNVNIFNDDRLLEIVVCEGVRNMLPCAATVCDRVGNNFEIQAATQNKINVKTRVTC